VAIKTLLVNSHNNGKSLCAKTRYEMSIGNLEGAERSGLHGNGVAREPQNLLYCGPV